MYVFSIGIDAGTVDPYLFGPQVFNLLDYPCCCCDTCSIIKERHLETLYVVSIKGQYNYIYIT